VDISEVDVQDVAFSLPALDDQARASSDRAYERSLTILFGVAILVSSWLLFLVQPMFAKMVLPRLGGTPAVWNTCVVFFQATLLGGYLYAHLTTRWLGVRRQALLHLGVLLLPLIALPIAVTGEPPPAGTPVWWLLGVLSLSVGLPFFVVSTTSPLLQRWFAAMPHRAAKDPYFLYSSSNFASLLALLSYPAIIEPTLRLADQSRMWMWAYGLFVALVAACAVTLRSSARQGLVHEDSEASAASTAAAQPLTWPVRLRWLAFSLVPSSLMLGVTTHISTDIAAVPLLWVVPLALYLATFMLVFARRPLVSARAVSRVLPFFVLATLVSMLFVPNPGYFVFLHLATFFMAALVCHHRLAATRPAPSHLTEFYLWMSIGGVLGGLFNTLAAPLIFNRILEYPLMLAAACALRPSPAFARRSPERWQELVGLPLMVAIVSVIMWALGLFGVVYLPTLLGFVIAFWLARLAFSNRPALFGILAAAAVLMFAFAPSQSAFKVLYAARTFFGVHRVIEDGSFHRLLHGGTVHGLQRRDVMNTCEPNSYYHQSGPLGQLFVAAGQRFTRVGVIGLGSGGTVCYGRPGQQWTFFEIDPTVERIARDTFLFTHLANTRAAVDVRLGDGRLLLAKAPPASFDLLILDAFSSDSIPLHLATREAIDLAFSRLRPDGVLAFHISNHYLDLAPVLGAIARESGLEARVNFDATLSPAEKRAGKQASQWLIMTRTVPAMGSLATDARWRAVPSAETAAWTDDFSNILSVFKWSNGPRAEAAIKPN
jgi:spermidine synthase